MTVGSILGYLVAWFTYRLYYPRLHSVSSHRPYSPRIPSSSSSENQISLPSHHHRAVSSSSDFDGSVDAVMGRNGGGDLEAGGGRKADIPLQPTGHVPGTVPREGPA